MVFWQVFPLTFKQIINDGYSGTLLYEALDQMRIRSRSKDPHSIGRSVGRRGCFSYCLCNYNCHLFTPFSAVAAHTLHLVFRW